MYIFIYIYIYIDVYRHIVHAHTQMYTSRMHTANLIHMLTFLKKFHKYLWFTYQCNFKLSEVK